jgi:hypothetical protein
MDKIVNGKRGWVDVRKPINLTKLIEKVTMPASDLLNSLQSLSRRCLIEQQGSFYDLPLVMKQYLKGL